MTATSLPAGSIDSFFAATAVTGYERQMAAITAIEDALAAGRHSVDLGYGRVLRGRRAMTESLAARYRSIA